MRKADAAAILDSQAPRQRATIIPQRRTLAVDTVKACEHGVAAPDPAAIHLALAAMVAAHGPDAAASIPGRCLNRGRWTLLVTSSH